MFQIKVIFIDAHQISWIQLHKIKMPITVMIPMFKRFKVIFEDALFRTQESTNPMDTSSSIHHRFDVEIQRGKFVEITSILKGESTWKLWQRFDVDISTWIWLSKSTKYRWVLHMDFSMSFRRQIDVTSVLAVSILSFSNIFCSGKLV